MNNKHRKDQKTLEINMGNLDFNNIDEKLKHLKNQDIIDLIRRYYGQEKVKDLLIEYNIEVTVGRFIGILPPKVETEKCIYCDKYLRSKLRSKTGYNSQGQHLAYCVNCGHTNEHFCKCKRCLIEAEEREKEKELQRLKENEMKQKKIYRALDHSNFDYFEENSLNLEDHLYLASLIRANLAEHTQFIESLDKVSRKIAPTDDFESEIIDHLSARGIIVPDKSSDIDAFEVGEEKISYGVYKVNWRINVKPEDGDYSEMIRRLTYPYKDRLIEDKETAFEMWKKIAYNEVIEYLLFQMERVNYSFNPGKKTRMVFEHLLDHFSVSQIYGVIYRAIANSTQRFQAGEITRIHAQNSVITSCENYGERAIANNWHLSNYNRIRELPETIINRVMFTSIMEIGELGFLEKPTKNY